MYQKKIVRALQIMFAMVVLFAVLFFSTVGHGEDNIDGSVRDMLILEERIIELERDMVALTVALQANMIGDCRHENVLRDMHGAPPIDLEGCLLERFTWYAEHYDLDFVPEMPPQA